MVAQELMAGRTSKGFGRSQTGFWADGDVYPVHNLLRLARSRPPFQKFLLFGVGIASSERLKSGPKAPSHGEHTMMNSLRFVCVAVCALVVTQCSGPGASPTAPSTRVHLAEPALDGDPYDLSGTEAIRPASKDLTTLAGPWKGDLTLLEQDGNVFRSKIEVTFVELGSGAFQGNGSITLTPTGTVGSYSATLSTGETQVCSPGTPVIYTGSASNVDKTLSISVAGMNDDCKFERLEFDLKRKQ
jgi:hypothetical protein